MASRNLSIGLEAPLTSWQRVGRTVSDRCHSRPPDGPKYDKEQLRELVSAVEECLVRGWWSCAVLVVRYSRGRSTAKQVQAARIKDGPILAQPEAARIARQCEIWLRDHSSAEGAERVLTTSRIDPEHHAEALTLDSPASSLALATRSDRILEERGVLTVGDVVRECERWQENNAHRPVGINNTAHAEVREALRRHGLLGPKAAAYLDYVSHTAGVQNLGKGRPVKEQT